MLNRVATVVSLSFKSDTRKIGVVMGPDGESNYAPKEKAAYQKSVLGIDIVHFSAYNILMIKGGISMDNYYKKMNLTSGFNISQTFTCYN